MKIQNKHRTLDTVKPERAIPHEACTAHDIMWTRPLSEYERLKQYIHFYDRNSMYVGATGGAELGIGDAVHYSKEQLDELREEKLPACGVWRVTVSPHEILSRMPVLSGTHWLTTPELYALAQIGNMDVEFHEAYIWPKHKRLLREWCNLMWQGRVALKTGHVECDIKKYPNVAARDVAYKLIKIIYKDAIGWLDPTSARETPKDGIDRNAKNEWVRPDWRKQIVGLARARMWLKMAELWHDYDMEPLAVYTDSLAYISDDPEPRTAVPNLMIREAGLGGFKHVRTVPITSQVIALFDSQLSESQIMHEVKDLVGVGV